MTLMPVNHELPLGPGGQRRPGRPASRAPAWLALAAALAAALLLGAACGDSRSETRRRDPASAQRYGPRDLTVQQRYGGQHYGGVATGDTQEGAAFARWVLEQDPQRQYITDAVVRNEQSLGVKVQQTVTKAELQRLLVALTEAMARTFPGRSLTVIAFYESGDKLAEANYNARTRSVDVRFV